MIAQVVLAAEEIGHIGPDTLAAKLSVPIGILLFCGSVFVLLWSIYGVKKAALIYSTAFFGFLFVLGVFWWFGAPGTPVATGPQNFPRLTEPRNPSDQYAPKWYAFEPGSERASFFPAANSLDGFQTLPAFVGVEDPVTMPEGDARSELEQKLESSPSYRFLVGDVDTAGRTMLGQFFPVDASASPTVGGERRAAWQAAAGDAPPGFTPARTFFTARVKDLNGDLAADVLIREAEEGVRMAAATLQVVATYERFTADGREVQEVVVEERPWFAFKDPGAIWFPSAVITGLSFFLFAGSLFGLDRMEMKEKKQGSTATQVREPIEAGAAH